MHAVCLKLVGKYDESYQKYQTLAEVCRLYTCEQLKNITCSLILLPLQRQREGIEDILLEFLEIMRMADKTDYYDESI